MTTSSDATFTPSPWQRELGIVFSLRDEFVWVSWLGTDASVRLGRHDMVASMMRDFLAQDALGKRLSEHTPGGGR